MQLSFFVVVGKLFQKEVSLLIVNYQCCLDFYIYFSMLLDFLYYKFNLELIFVYIIVQGVDR